MDNATVSSIQPAQALDSIDDYFRLYGPALAARIVDSLPPLHRIEDPVSPLLAKLRRKPYPAQALAVMGVAKRLERSRSAAVVAECGTGKTLIALASIFVHSQGRPFTALVLTPPHLVEKWGRECFQTLPGVRVFLIDGLRSDRPHTLSGVNEVKLRHGRIVREGLNTNLTELRLHNGYRSARARWDALCDSLAIFVVGRERAKLSHFWKHAYNIARCGRYARSIVNPDSGCPIYISTGGERLLRSDFRDVKLAEWLGGKLEESGETNGKHRRALYSPLWQADGSKIHRFAPAEFISRYMRGFFDYAVADEVHELKGGDTAQGNALGSLAACAKRTLVLTGTLLGGYADELFHILYRLEPRKMLERGFEHSAGGIQYFTETYGLLEKVSTGCA